MAVPATAAHNSDPEISFERLVGHKLATISYAGFKRSISSWDFGPSADLREADKGLGIRVIGSGFPGTGFLANGTITLVYDREVWNIRFSFDRFRFQDLLLYDWIRGARHPEARSHDLSNYLAASFPYKAVRMALDTTTLLFVPAADATDASQVQNEFVIADADRRIRLGQSGFQPSSGRVAIRAVPQAADSRPANSERAIPSSLVGDVLDTPATRLTVIEDPHFDDADPLGTTPGGTSIFVLDRKAWSSTFYFYDSRIGDHSTKNSLVAGRVEFDGRFRFEPKGINGGRPPLPEPIVERATYSMLRDRERQLTAITGTAPFKEVLLPTGHVSLVVSAAEEPAEIVRLTGNVVEDFGFEAVLRHAFVPLHAADFSRFDFSDTLVKFALEEFSGQHRPTKAYPFVYSIGAVPHFAGLLDDRALLRVHRSVDLLDLRFKFNAVLLESRPGESHLDDCRKRVAGFEISDGSKPTLIAIFPPQHIAEKAYLRIDDGIAIPQANRKKLPNIDKNRAYQNQNDNFEDALEPGPNHIANLSFNQAQARSERDPDTELPDGLLEVFDHVVEARASGETRLVFEFSDDADGATAQQGNSAPKTLLPLAFSLNALTRWDGLRLKVARRAQLKAPSVIEQLRVAGLAADELPIPYSYGGAPLRFEQKMGRLREVLAGSLEPGPYETSIEFPYRLMLSPESGSVWRTPAQPTDAQIARGLSIFSARLDPDFGGDSVRAVWSPDFRRHYRDFFHDDPVERRLPRHENRAPWAAVSKYRDMPRMLRYIRWLRGTDQNQFRMSLDERDRFELVTLTSVYGLPALLPVPALATAGDGTKIAIESERQSADPSIVALPGNFPVQAGPFGKEGLYVPKPLGRAEIALSALGATANLAWQGEPPPGFIRSTIEGRQFPALTVERWRHRAFQGRDVEVEVVYKGFLFPFGHRCSVVKATERTYHEDPRHPNSMDLLGQINQNGASVAYLTQRFFVIVGEPDKPYPALGQPYAGRAFPFSGVRILTARSPDILDPFENDINCEGGECPKNPEDDAVLPRAFALGASAFFPKGSDGKDVLFDYALVYADGTTSQKLSAPLVVADNTLVHDAKAVSELIHYYNTRLGGTERRLSRAFGQRVKYAPEKSEGDTEFKTRDLVLGAQPREVHAHGPADAAFVMDAVMEGADQPPFYPVLHTANIEIQSLNTMNGRSEGYTPTSHDEHFLKFGFAPGRNDAEIYLTIHGQNHLALQNRANASGGIATPNNKIVSLSRMKGPVGGANAVRSTREILSELPEFGKNRAVARNRSLSTSATDTASGGALSKLPASHQNKFDPLEFFGSALSQAKLFGIIPLKDVVRALSFVEGAPEMLERISYSLIDLTQGVQTEAVDLVRSLKEALRGAEVQVAAKLEEYGSQIGSPLTLTPDHLYPRLFAAMRKSAQTLEALEAKLIAFAPPTNTSDTEKVDAVVAATGNAAESIKILLSEIKAVIRKPTPAIVDQVVGRISSGVRELKTQIDATLSRLTAFAPDDFIGLFSIPEIRVPAGANVPETLDGIFDTPEMVARMAYLGPIFGLYEDDVRARFQRRAVEVRNDDDNSTNQKKTVYLWDKDQSFAFSISASEGRRQAQEALMYETVGKKLIDGYVAYESFKNELLSGTISLETAAKDLPERIFSIAEDWLRGLLATHQFAAFAQKLERDTKNVFWKDVIEPALVDGIFPVIDPVLRKATDLRTDAQELDSRIAALVVKLEKLLRASKLPDDLKPEVQRLVSTLAKLQKALTAHMARFDAVVSQIVRTEVEEGKFTGWLDLAEPSYTDIAYYKHLNDEYDKPLSSASQVQGLVSQFNARIGQFLSEKDRILRQSRDAVAAAVDAVGLSQRIGQAFDITARAQGASPSARSRSAAMTDGEAQLLKSDLQGLRANVAEVVEQIGLMAGRITLSDLHAKHASIKLQIEKAKDQYAEISDDFDSISGRYNTLYGNLLSAVDVIEGPNFDKTDPDAVKKYAAGIIGATDGFIAYTIGEERYVAGLLAQAYAIYGPHQEKLYDGLYGYLTPLLTEIVDTLIAIHDAARDVFDTIREALTPSGDMAAILKLFVSPALIAFLEDTSSGSIDTAFTEERGLLSDIRTQLAAADPSTRLDGAQKFLSLVEGWAEGKPKPAVQVAMGPLNRIVEIVTTGKFNDFIDLSGLRRELERALLSFIPNEIAFDYGWGSTLEAFPSESYRLFWIDREYKHPGFSDGSLIKKYVDEQKAGGNGSDKPANDLVIVSKAGVRITSLDEAPKPYFNIESQISNPSINLFGKSFDIVTVRLDYIRFTADENGSDLDVMVRKDMTPGSAGVEFGEVVEYISNLAQAFPDYVPPWLDILFDPPGVAAKFGFPAFSISIGNMSILNLAVNIRVEIPFDNRPITGRFALSERDKPFLISFAPYGGGGYMALRTHATSIVGFELQLEFGAVVGVNFGPLRGFGLVAAGVYIEKVSGQDLVIAGFVRAIGEGSLGCFAIAVHLEVRVTQRGSQVSGEATFAYSFKLGFAKFRFKFTAGYEFAGGSGSGGGGGSRLMSPETIVEEATLRVTAAVAVLQKQAAARMVPAIIVNDVPDKLSDWQAYRSQFAF